MFAKHLKGFTNVLRTFSTKPTTNNEIVPIICNRNPRNLERLRLEKKPTGYFVDADHIVEYWHKLEIVDHSFYISAKLIHNSGREVVVASTKEWAIRKVLYSATDKQAYLVLAKVFAERCMESGITSFRYDKATDKEDTKKALFIKILEEEDLQLEEPPLYDIYDVWRRREKRPWTVIEDEKLKTS